MKILQLALVTQKEVITLILVKEMIIQIRVEGKITQTKLLTRILAKLNIKKKSWNVIDRKKLTTLLWVMEAVASETQSLLLPFGKDCWKDLAQI